MSWFKPFKMEFAPFAEFGNPQIDEILKNHYLPNTQHTVLSLVTQRQQQNDVLGLTLKLPAGYQVTSEADFEQLHNSLASDLEKAGIRELNLHFVTQKASGSQQQQSQVNLPPVTNAQAQSAVQRQTAHAEAGRSEAVQREDQLTAKRPAPPTQSQLQAHPRIKHVIVVASGKGGVGKSTTTVNLALALQQTGAKVGVLDADIYGPSVPTMLGTAGKTPLIENEQFIPLEAFGMAVLSIGNLTGDDNTPVVWRGPKATGALMQLFNQTAWPDLDYLLIDMPPGTGDIQLTLAQRIPVTGAVIVTTPQHVALMDAQKGIELFNKVNIPVLGVVENMSTHVCSNCGHTDEIFGTGGGDKLSAAYQVPLLGRLPLNASIRQNADRGTPSVIAKDSANDNVASHYKDIALAMLVQLAKIPSRERDSNRIF
ncbi:iron-sulfur cluster carrier protein ApbC [Alkanindiges illinoisensis]|uniref:iron-sulfur cluster carrier protein ApbC n=1 Tax=Alkanindiges illinoisensis TaxID=197183 RepID=UPI00047EA796